MIIKKYFPGDSHQDKKITQISILLNKNINENNSFEFIFSKISLYSPSIDDLVIGKVIYIHSSYYKLDLNGVFGILPTLSFLNATKRNKPNLNSGDYVLCRVKRVSDELLLDCNENGLGLLKMKNDKVDKENNKVDKEIGVVLDIESWKVKFLYFNTTLLYKLGREFKYKIALGMNGKVYLFGKVNDLKVIYNELKTMS
ncbi:Exosome complex component RRP40 [Dictyocoela muelleri]|nr:Exosome complex component RRP40 [Dictyocoela muelleri]